MSPCHHPRVLATKSRWASSLWPRWRAAETVPRAALVLCELRAAPVRSGQAGAPQRGQGDGRKVLRTGGFDDEGIYTKVLKWNLLEFTRIYFFGGDYSTQTLKVGLGEA